MEKNQQPRNAATINDQEKNIEAGKQPGQQLPAGGQTKNLDAPSTQQETVQHSESGFPQKENETLGTP